MNRKQLAILLVLVVVVGGLGVFFQRRNTASWSAGSGSSGDKVLKLPINDVARVTIKSASGELNLVKTGDVWSVQERANYPANFEQVSSLLRKVWDLKPVQDVKVGPSQMPRLQLVEPGKGDNAGTLVDFKDKDGKRIAALLLGKTYVRKSENMPGEFGGFPAGRYVIPLDGTNRVSLVSEPLDEADSKPERWLEREFIHIEKPKSIVLAGQTPAMNWKLTRDSETAEWKLDGAKPDEKLDTSKVGSFATLFSSASFSDVLAPDAKPDTTGLDKPAIATTETFDGFVYTLKIGKATGDNFPVTIAVSENFPKERKPGKDEKPEDKTKLDQEFQNSRKQLEEKFAKEKKFEGRPYLIAKFTVEPLLKERAQLLEEKKPAPPPATTPPPAATSPITPPAPTAPSAPAPPPSVPTPAPKPAPAAPSTATPTPKPAPAPPAQDASTKPQP
jgi:uncharacterized protein DUF4340